MSRKMTELAHRQIWPGDGKAHREIAAALTLYNESLHEFGSRAAGTEAERQKSLAIISRLQEVFLAMVVINRRRLVLNQFAVPAPWLQRLQTLDETISRHLKSWPIPRPD